MKYLFSVFSIYFALFGMRFNPLLTTVQINRNSSIFSVNFIENFIRNFNSSYSLVRVWKVRYTFFTVACDMGVSREDKTESASLAVQCSTV